MEKALSTTSSSTQKAKHPFPRDENWTMRLISSERFNASMAIEYLFSVQDKPSLSLLGKRLFDFPKEEVDFFLPQLIYLYVAKIDVASVTHAYIEERHKGDTQFTVLCIWLLNCYAEQNFPIHANHSTMLRSCLCDDDLNPAPREDTLLSLNRLEENSWIPRSSCDTNFGLRNIDITEQKDQTVPIQLDVNARVNCQRKFINRLIHIGNKLAESNLTCSKQIKTNNLQLELQMLNSMLPNTAWIPFDSGNRVLNICANECAVLNSKDKVPYIFFAEVQRFTLFSPNQAQYSYSGRSMNLLHNVDNITFRPSDDKLDPSVAVFSESWNQKKNRIKATSKFKNVLHWDLIPVIVKTGDDLTQESFAQQLLFIFQDLWLEEGVPLYLRPYKIICIGPCAGLVEPVLDTLSLHQIKRQLTNFFQKTGNSTTPTLMHYFEKAFGPASSECHVNAQKNFIQSTAAYSLVSYFLQLKDRHNGNILLDKEGHLIHIDYGFLLSSSPRNLGFETAPFKLTSEIIEVMGGLQSDMFLYYKSLLLRGLMAARKHHRRIVSLAEIMSIDSKMQCFRAGLETVRALESRFHVSSTDEQLQQLVETLVDGSRDSYTTRFYDSYQYYTNGIH